MPPSHTLFQSATPFVPIRGIHLDLKGLPPPFPRLLEWLDLFAALRFNAILVEWEDTFPWTCNPAFRGPTYYTPEEVTRFAEKCKQLEIEIIPLVQSLGHSENVLSKIDDISLRELPWRTDVFHPLNPASADIVRRMMDDVINLLPDIQRFHLGGDEVATLGEHPASQAHIAQHGIASLYLKQFAPLIDHLETLQIRPLFWHDEFVQWPEDSLSKIAKRVDLVVWGYSGDPRDPETYHHRLPHIEKLAEAGFSLWGATAYKGADGASYNRPRLLRRQAASLGWAEMHSTHKWQGIFATGWSRYTSARVQTEPIESALDSLVNTAVILHEGTPPAKGSADCQAWITEHGKGELFERCKSAMDNLSKLSDRAWDLIRALEEQLAQLSIDPMRANSGIEQVLLDLLKNQSTSLHEAQREGIETFREQIAQPWLDHYYRARLEPIETAILRLESELAQRELLSPESNSFCKKNSLPKIDFQNKS